MTFICGREIVSFEAKMMFAIFVFLTVICVVPGSILTAREPAPKFPSVGMALVVMGVLCFFAALFVCLCLYCCNNINDLHHLDRPHHFV